jgi:steroid delta-isomerase-like uncharacterized protein
MSSTAPTPQMSPQALIDAAKAQVLAYNEKNWDAVRTSLSRTAVYDEVATRRRMEGIDQIIACWKGWATALPDSKATLHNAVAGNNVVTLELTWRGTHTGPLDLPSGQVPPTNRSIELRACQVVEMADGKPQTVRQYFDMATLLEQLGLMR